MLYSLLILFGFILAVSSNWAFGYFGLSCFEQLVYHIKVPLEGTNTEFIFDWFKVCLTKAIVYTMICFLPTLLFSYYKEYYSFISIVLFVVCTIYAAFKIGLIGFIINLFRKTDLYEKYYVDSSKVELTFPDKKRNLIYIFLESMENTYSSKENGGNYKEDLIPELSSLAFDNIHFSQGEKLGGAKVIAGTGWTTAGIVAQSSGVPLFTTLDFPAFNDQREFLPGVTSLGDILEKEGYNQEYLIGSDAIFGGRKFYFDKHGHYDIFDLKTAYQKKKIPEDYRVFWGYEDEKLFTFAKEEITRLSKQDKPFNFTMLTVDTHHPKGYVCSKCENQYKERLSNVIRCNSKQVGEFIEWLKQQDFYENTTIVVAGDHLSMAAEYIHSTYDKDYEHTTYNCFVNSVSQDQNSKNRKFTSFDMFPTTLAAMGVKINGEHLGLGVNLFSGEKTLLEKMGEQKLDQELRKQSDFYKNCILKKK